MLHLEDSAFVSHQERLKGDVLADDLSNRFASELSEKLKQGTAEGGFLRDANGVVLLEVKMVYRGTSISQAAGGQSVRQFDLVADVYYTDLLGDVRHHLDSAIMEVERLATFTSAIEITWCVVQQAEPYLATSDAPDLGLAFNWLAENFGCLPCQLQLVLGQCDHYVKPRIRGQISGCSLDRSGVVECWKSLALEKTANGVTAH